MQERMEMNTSLSDKLTCLFYTGTHDRTGLIPFFLLAGSSSAAKKQALSLV
jgi:hypothetical protein